MLVGRNTTTPILYYNYSHSQTSVHTHAKNSYSMGKTIHYWGLKYHVRAPSKWRSSGPLFSSCVGDYVQMYVRNKGDTFGFGWLHEHIWGHRWLAQMYVKKKTQQHTHTRRILSAENQTHTPMDACLTVAIAPLPVRRWGGVEGSIPRGAVNTFLHLLPPTRLLINASQRAQMLTGFHTGGAAAC